MPDPATAIMGAVSIGGSLLSSRAASKAAKAQTAADQAAIAETRAARLDAEQRLQPYVDSGYRANAMRDFILYGNGSGQAPSQAPSVPNLTERVSSLQNELAQLNAIDSLSSGWALMSPWARGVSQHLGVGDGQPPPFVGELSAQNQQRKNQIEQELASLRGQQNALTSSPSPSSSFDLTRHITSLPGYQFVVDETDKAASRSLASQGRRDLTPAGQKELSEWVRQRAIVPFYDTWAQQVTNTANTGQNAAVGSGNIALNSAGGVSNLLQDIGSARGNAALIAGNAQSNALSDIGSMFFLRSVMGNNKIPQYSRGNSLPGYSVYGR